MGATLPNGFTIDTDNPVLHTKPSFCRNCRTFYYFGGHFCVEDEHDKKILDNYFPSPAKKVAEKGYFNGEQQK